MSDENPNGYLITAGNTVSNIAKNDFRVICREHHWETVDFEDGVEIIACARCGAQGVE